MGNTAWFDMWLLLAFTFDSTDVPPIDCHSEDSFVVVGHVGVSSASTVENKTSASCTGSEESFEHLNLTGNEELSTPAVAINNG